MEFSFVYGVRKGSKFILSYLEIQSPWLQQQKRHFFCTEQSWHLLKTAGAKSLLGSQASPSVYESTTGPHSLPHCSFVVSFETEMWSPPTLFFCKAVLALLCPWIQSSSHTQVHFKQDSTGRLAKLPNFKMASHLSLQMHRACLHPKHMMFFTSTWKRLSAPHSFLRHQEWL